MLVRDITLTDDENSDLRCLLVDEIARINLILIQNKHVTVDSVCQYWLNKKNNLVKIYEMCNSEAHKDGSCNENN